METKEKTITTEEQALKLVCKDGYNLQHIPEKLKTEKVVQAAIADGTRYEYIPKQFRTFTLCLEKCPEYGSDTTEFLRRYANSEEWGISPSAMAALVKKGVVPSFKKVPAKMQDEIEVAVFKYALKKDILNIGKLPQHLRHLITEDHAIKSFNNYESSGYRSSSWTGDKFIHLIPKKAMTKHAVKELQKILTSRVQNDSRRDGGFNVSKIPQEYMTKELYELAVKFSSYNLEHVPAEFKTKELCKMAIEKDGNALKHVPADMRTEFYISVVKSGAGLDEIPMEDRTDKLCVLAVETNAKQFEHVPDDKKSYSLCLAALDQDAEMFRFIPHGMVDDEITIRFVIAVLNKKYSNDWYINDKMREGEKMSLLDQVFAFICPDELTKGQKRDAKEKLFTEVITRDPKAFGRLVYLSDERDVRWKPFHNSISVDLCMIAFIGDEKNIECIPTEYNKAVWKAYMLTRHK